MIDLLKIALATLILISPAPVHADIPSVDNPVIITEATSTIVDNSVQNKISNYASMYSINPELMRKVVSCETAGTFDPTIQSSAIRPDGSREKSFGLAQIYLPAHINITYNQAIDPDFALSFMAQAIATGNGSMWTCYRNLKAKGII